MFDEHRLGNDGTERLLEKRGPFLPDPEKGSKKAAPLESGLLRQAV